MEEWKGWVGLLGTVSITTHVETPESCTLSPTMNNTAPYTEASLISFIFCELFFEYVYADHVLSFSDGIHHLLVLIAMHICKCWYLKVFALSSALHSKCGEECFSGILQPYDSTYLPNIGNKVIIPIQSI